MVLRVIGTGSAGNCYALISKTGTLLLDCGLPINKIKQALDYNVASIAGVCVTHGHQDHCKAADALEHMGIPVFKPYDGGRMRGACGDFDVQSFELTNQYGRFMHTNGDGTECPCYGYLISHKEMGRLLYITDTEFVKWRFRDISHIIVSCNYSKDLLLGDHPARKHILQGHMELETVKDFVGANKSDALLSVILAHISDGNGDPMYFKGEVVKTAGRGVLVATAANGDEYTLHNKRMGEEE